jgi:hypothetical protein
MSPIIPSSTMAAATPSLSALQEHYIQAAAKNHTPLIYYPIYVFVALSFVFIAVKRLIGHCPRLTVAYYLPPALFTSWAPGRKRFELEEEVQATIKKEEERQMNEREHAVGRNSPRLFATMNENDTGRTGSRGKKAVMEEIEMNMLAPAREV